MKIILTLLSCFVMNSMASDPQSLINGKKIYDSVCFACHGKNLEGSIGHNLKDDLWVHGGTKEQIIATIRKGFPEKGMIPFGTVYNEKQISDLADFILSRQEGIRDLEYSIYHNVSVADKIDWEKKKADKQGKMRPAFINLSLPEVNQFAIKYKGKLLIPESIAGEFDLNGIIRQREGLWLFIDGKEVKIKQARNKTFSQKIHLSAGVHNIELRFIKAFKNVMLDMDLVGKSSIPLSSDSYQKSITSTHIVKANDSFTILRKRVDSLPARAIVVNHQDKMSYAINPADAAINAVWSGESMDIGPNIYARGQEMSKILGKDLYSKNQNIELIIGGSPQKLRFLGYSNKPKPKFMYQYGPHQFSIESFMGPDGLVLSYSFGSKNSPKVQIKLPQELNVNSTAGKCEGAVFTPENSDSFQIVIPVLENK